MSNTPVTKKVYYRWVITLMVLGYMFLFGPAILASQAFAYYW